MDAPDNSSETVRLGRLATDLGFLLRLAQVKVCERYLRQCGEHQVKPGEFSILWAISHNPGIRQNVLCQHLIIKRSHMTKLVQLLENRGLVSRRIPDDDRRGVELTLTAVGQTVVDDIATWFFAFEDSLGAEMDEPERSRLVDLLQAFIASENSGG